MKIGDPVWLFDENRRVYDADRRLISGWKLIYRSHFREMRIVGETPKSWIIGYAETGSEYGKIPKAGEGDTRQMKDRNWTYTFYLSAQAVEDAVFCNDNRSAIAERVRRADAATLRAVLALLDEGKAER